MVSIMLPRKLKKMLTPRDTSPVEQSTQFPRATGTMYPQNSWHKSQPL